MFLDVFNVQYNAGKKIVISEIFNQHLRCHHSDLTDSLFDFFSPERLKMNSMCQWR